MTYIMQAVESHLITLLLLTQQTVAEMWQTDNRSRRLEEALLLWLCSNDAGSGGSRSYFAGAKAHCQKLQP